MVQMHFIAYISQRTPRRSHGLTFRAESDWLQVSSTIACSVQLSSKTSAYQLVVFDSIFRLLFIWLLWSLKQLWMRHRRHCWADNSNHARQQRAPLLKATNSRDSGDSVYSVHFSTEIFYIYAFESSALYHLWVMRWDGMYQWYFDTLWLHFRWWSC